ncbi:SDR family NAD(P)-dependent oxidoreductase [Candidatus Parcubacteria bacterium]|nr:SDR family NAD(P)-dependent oxidoreductase [Candidatus Parcubacteria bacterium]
MKILITGASGGIGKILIKKLIKAGFDDLAVLSRGQFQFEKTEKLKIKTGNLNDFNSLDKALKNIDVVMHLAGVTHTNKTKKYFQINTEGTKNLLQAAEKNFVKKFIFISSRAASQTGGAYAYSKFLAEQMVKKYKHDWIILKPAEIYGAKNDEVIQKLINKIKKSYFIPVPGKGDSELSPVFVDDVVAAIINSIQSEKNNTSYILAGADSFSYKNLVNLIARAYNKKIKIIYIPLFILKIAALIFPRLLVKDQIPRLLVKKSDDIGLAREYLNFKPRGFGKGIKNLE